MKSFLFTLLILLTVMHGFAQSTSSATGRDPIATFGNLEGVRPTATIKEILANPKFTITHPEFKVIKFTFSLLPNKGEFWGPFTVSGAELTPKIMEGLKAYAGQSGKIFLEEITVNGPDRRPRNLSSVVIIFTN